jgi:hypothetical protein
LSIVSERSLRAGGLAVVTMATDTSIKELGLWDVDSIFNGTW